MKYQSLVEELDEPMANINKEDLPENPLPVAPITAPPQNHYVHSVDNRDVNQRKCAAAPFGCPKLGINCSWNIPEKCKLVQKGEIVVPQDIKTRGEMIRKYKLKRNRERRKEKRDSEKRVSPGYF